MSVLVRVLLCATVLWAATGCGGDEESQVCDQAIEDVTSRCPKVKITQQGDPNCSGQTECAMACVLKATCAELEADSPDSAYGECKAACSQK